MGRNQSDIEDDRQKQYRRRCQVDDPQVIEIPERLAPRGPSWVFRWEVEQELQPRPSKAKVVNRLRLEGCPVAGTGPALQTKDL